MLAEIDDKLLELSRTYMEDLGRSTEDLLRQGLRQYTYFEARKVLKPLGANDLCSEFPAVDKG